MNKDQLNKKKGTDEIRETIDNTIEEIKNIPDIVSTQLGLNTEKIKGDLIPQLDKQKSRLDDFDKIDEHIDSIRKEIINPVNEVIEKNSATSRKFNILFGTIGAFGTIFTIIGLYIALRADNKVEPNTTTSVPTNKQETMGQTPENQNTTFKDLRSLFSDNFSKECLELTDRVQAEVNRIGDDLKTKSDSELRISRDDLLKSTVAIESNGCIDRFISNGLYDEIYKSIAAICLKIDDNVVLSALIDQYDKLNYEKNKKAKYSIRLFGIEADFKESNDENRYASSLQNLLNEKVDINVLSPNSFKEIKLNDYIRSQISSINEKVEKETFEVWVFDAPKIYNSQVTPFVEELKKEGFKKVIKKGVIDGEWEIPWMYYRNSSVKNSSVYKKIVQKRQKYEIIRYPEIYTNSNYGVIKNHFNSNKNLKVIVIL